MTTQLKDVYAIPEKEGEDKTYWPRIGVASVNKDSSLNVYFNCIPISGKIHIRDRKSQKKTVRKEP